MNILLYKNRFKQWVKKVSKQVGLYDLFVSILGFERGIQLKLESDKLRSRRKQQLNQQVKVLSAQEPYSVVVLVIDALRADRLGYHNYPNQTSPFLDSLAQESILAYKHYASAPWTWPTVNSLLTGLYPHNHGATINEDPRGFNRINFPKLLPYDIPTVPEILERAGYTTKLISSVVTADLATKGIFDREYFSQVKWEHHPMEKMVDKLLSFASAKSSTPTYTYMHVKDVHMPISVPVTYLPEDEQKRWEGKKWGRIFRIYEWDKATEEERMTQMRRRNYFYDASIKYVDDQLKRVIEEYKKRGLYENTLFIITADHGEEMWDHADLEYQLFAKHKPHLIGREHGYSLFEEMIHIPLLITGGPIKSAQKISEVTSHVDIAPTILDTIGVQTDIKFDGISLLRDVPGNRAVFSEEIGYGYEQKAIILRDKKLIRSEGYQFEILERLGDRYDISVMGLDESQNPEIKELRSKLLAFSNGEKVVGVSTEVSDAAVKKRLEDLGYM